jgi:hypothetical protein
MDVTLIKPEVDAVIHNRVTDKRIIESLLDQLLNYAGMSESGLTLFKCLCRYYYYINLEVTAEYIYAYRDLYDSDDIEEDEEED